MTSTSPLSVRVPAVPASVAFVRATARQAAGIFGLPKAARDDYVLVTDELVTNAVNCCPDGDLVVVTFCVADDCPIVLVQDTSAQPPVVQAPALDAESGRGLFICSYLCKEITADPAPGGKIVRAVLPCFR
jgi:anti-sigma regulatory factor (Ser/Thr protein kinase)